MQQRGRWSCGTAPSPLPQQSLIETYVVLVVLRGNAALEEMEPLCICFLPSFWRSEHLLLPECGVTCVKKSDFWGGWECANAPPMCIACCRNAPLACTLCCVIRALGTRKYQMRCNYPKRQ